MGYISSEDQINCSLKRLDINLYAMFLAFDPLVVQVMNWQKRGEECFQSKRSKVFDIKGYISRVKSSVKSLQSILFLPFILCSHPIRVLMIFKRLVTALPKHKYVTSRTNCLCYMSIRFRDRFPIILIFSFISLSFSSIKLILLLWI